MITIGSTSRSQASEIFPFLAEQYRGRRKAIKAFTHLSPDFVFWISPDGKLFDAKQSHRENLPKGHEHILEDEPDYGGFLRGRVASNCGEQLIVVYCKAEALAASGPHLDQFVKGLRQLPVPIHDSALVVSDNGDMYGTIRDVYERQVSHNKAFNRTPDGAG